MRPWFSGRMGPCQGPDASSILAGRTSMGEIIKFENPHNEPEGERNNKSGKSGEVLSFEKAKEMSGAGKRIKNFEKIYNQLKFLKTKPGSSLELGARMGAFIEEIEDFETEVIEMQENALKESESTLAAFNKMVDEKGFETADEKFGAESLKDDERLIKISRILDEISELKERAISLLE